MRKVAAVSVFALSFIRGVYAQSAQPPTTTVPRLVRISNTFHPADGQPAAPVESVTLSIYRDEQGGSPLWQETQNVKVDAEGRYSALLGATATDGLPLDLLNSTEPRWLGVKFNRPGEVEQPRTLLASVPYALRASDAETLGGLPASDYLRATLVGTSSTVSNTNAVNMAGTTSVAASLRPRYSTGTANFIPLLLDGSGDTTNSVLYQNGLRIGLQTVSPADYLHVVFNDNTGSFTGYAVQNLNSVGFSGMLFYDQNSTLGQFQGFNNSTHEYRINNISSLGTINFMINSSSKLLVANNGNIGMGMTSPAYNLDVAGAIRVGAAAVLQVPATASVGLGYQALPAATGNYNTAMGYQTISNYAAGGATGQEDSAFGAFAGYKTTSGSFNVAVGYAALWTNTTGNNNTAIGFFAGAGSSSSTTGSNNISIGSDAGSTASTGGGSNNIEIGNVGVSTDSGVIRIGTLGTQTAFYAAGIAGMSSGTEVVINTSTGQIGYFTSSRRYKEDIHDMGDASRGLMRLRPVTFRYKKPSDDGSKPIQYGLIAEEVAEVYPDLVVRNADGQIETVKYQVLAPMLLNEVQRQQVQSDAQAARIAALEQQNQMLLERLGKLEAAIASSDHSR